MYAEEVNMYFLKKLAEQMGTSSSATNRPGRGNEQDAHTYDAPEHFDTYIDRYLVRS